jgi:lipoyl(octanoyl) transferase
MPPRTVNIMSSCVSPFEHIPLGIMPYADAYEQQQRWHERVLASRDTSSPMPGVILSVEHPPVITISRRAAAADHLVASRDWLVGEGVSIEETDRGGDITYHGPGQLVLYPIIDLNRLKLGLHDYMRLLEQSVIDACASWGVEGHRDPHATGVWVRSPGSAPGPAAEAPLAKVAAFGVRVRRWISMHGLALNVRTNLQHFAYIVPCGLHGRPVTSLAKELGANAPTLDAAREVVVARLIELLQDRLNKPGA